MAKKKKEIDKVYGKYQENHLQVNSLKRLKHLISNIVIERNIHQKLFTNRKTDRETERTRVVAIATHIHSQYVYGYMGKI